MPTVRMLLADDHEVVLEGLRRMLDRPDFEIVGTVRNGRALVEAASALKPDLIVVDITMPLLNGIDAVREIRKFDDRVKIIFLTMHPDVPFATEALSVGGSAYLLKSSAGELLKAIETVRAGETFITASIEEPVRRTLVNRSNTQRQALWELTPRKREVLQLLAEGRQVKEIAAMLNISPRTVEFHKYGIMETLGARTVADLARFAAKNGIVE